MKIEDVLNRSTKSKFITKKLFLLIALIVIMVYAIFHLDGLFDLAGFIISLFKPFLIGIIIAFVLNVIVKIFEEKIFAGLNRKNYKIWNKIRRGICILIALVVVLLLLTAVMFLIVPELGRSLQKLAYSAPKYVNDMQGWILGLVKDLNLTPDIMNQITATVEKFDWSKIISMATSLTTGLVGSIVTVTMDVTSGAVVMFMSIIFAIYMLFGKEKLILNIKRLMYAFLSERTARKTIEVSALANKIFANFVAGQCTEALIIGSLCYLGLSIFRFPYALLISAVICVTSVIPIFGAYIGAIFGGFILLLISPMWCLGFVIFIVVLQNVEGNLIYPKVVGSSVGLPGIWVMLSIFVFGDLFGFIGMLLGVPTGSLLYSLLKTSTARKLKEKNISEREVLANKIGIAPLPPEIELEQIGFDLKGKEK